MKKLFIALSLLVFIAGCNKVVDPCEGVTCQNGGTCVTGTCNCGTNYEGTNCATEVRAKYIGPFNGTEACNPSGNSTYSVTSTAVTGDVGKVNFANLYNAGFNTVGTVQTDGSITIATQSFGTGTISGSVVVTGGKVKITYVVSAGGASDNCVWTQS